MYPILNTEAICILFAYNLCLGLLTSAVILNSEPVNEPNMPVIKTQSVCMAAEVAERVSENAVSECYEESQQQEEYEQTCDEEEYEAYVCESVIPQQEENEESVETTEIYCFSEGFDSSFKAYMDYRCITDTSSVQYSLQQQAYTDDRGFRRIGDDYCIALGTGITDGCGERFLVTLDSGYSFSAIVSDVKADIHTDSTNCYAPRGENAGNIVEFIIDTDNADSFMLTCGSAGCFEDLSGNVVSVEKI